MMKWARRKAPTSSPSSSSSRSTSISHVIPASWISKFKQISGQGKGKRAKGNGNSPASCRDSRPYGGDDERFLRLSFGEEALEGRKKCGGVLRSVYYDSDDELEFPPPNEEKELTWKFSDMVSDIRKTREFEETELRLMRESLRDGKLRKINSSGVKEKLSGLKRAAGKAKEKIAKEERKDTSEFETVQMQERDYLARKNLRSCKLRTIEEETFPLSAEELNLKQRKSLYISRDSQKRSKPSSKIRVNSPRAASRIEICKIKAIEDMKKAKTRGKKKKNTKERNVDKTKPNKTILESFAVVKCSFDPRMDFRESMVEMIEEKRIRRPEEFEELLACYLMLNADEYHDLIIKVFRQVWFDLNQTCFRDELPNET